MGGRIWVESEPGRAARSLHAPTFPAGRSFRRGADEPVLVGLPVLIVDDNEVNRRIFHEVLTRGG